MLIIEQETEDFRNIGSFLVMNNGEIHKTDYYGLKKIAKKDLCFSDVCDDKILLEFDKKITHFCSPMSVEEFAAIAAVPSSMGGIRKRSYLDDISMMVRKNLSGGNLSTNEAIALLNHPFSRGLLVFIKEVMTREYNMRHQGLSSEIEDWLVRVTYLIISRNFSPFFLHDDTSHIGLLFPEHVTNGTAQAFWDDMRELEKRLTERVDDSICLRPDVVRVKPMDVTASMYSLFLFAASVWEGSYGERIGEFLDYDSVPEKYREHFKEVCKEYFFDDNRKMINREIRKVTKDWKHPMQLGRESKEQTFVQPLLKKSRTSGNIPVLPCSESKRKPVFQPSPNDYLPLLKEECEKLMGSPDEPRCKYMLYQTISNTPLLPYLYDTINGLLADAVRVHVPIVGTHWLASIDEWAALCRVRESEN
ncbi:MAG: hypothetical protein LBT46_10180 [Planctomycetaceae bacterium]|jgi:hypothetical protein|nr:hypothetical protein [Planctomycetaceae bacterium]